MIATIIQIMLISLISYRGLKGSDNLHKGATVCAIDIYVSIYPS